MPIIFQGLTQDFVCSKAVKEVAKLVKEKAQLGEKLTAGQVHESLFKTAAKLNMQVPNFLIALNRGINFSQHEDARLSYEWKYALNAVYKVLRMIPG